MFKDVLYVGAMLLGAILAIRNEISPKKTGVIMSIPFVTTSVMILINQWFMLSEAPIRYSIVEFGTVVILMAIGNIAFGVLLSNQAYYFQKKRRDVLKNT